MRNKILIVDEQVEDREELGQILQEVMEEGGELFFADKREDGIAILKQEIPQLVLLNFTMEGDKKEWTYEGVHVIYMRPRHAGEQNQEESIFKPFKRAQVLQKCRSVLSRVPAAQIPPM